MVRRAAQLLEQNGFGVFVQATRREEFGLVEHVFQALVAGLGGGSDSRCGRRNEVFDDRDLLLVFVVFVFGQLGDVGRCFADAQLVVRLRAERKAGQRLVGAAGATERIVHRRQRALGHAATGLAVHRLLGRDLFEVVRGQRRVLIEGIWLRAAHAQHVVRAANARATVVDFFGVRAGAGSQLLPEQERVVILRIDFQHTRQQQLGVADVAGLEVQLRDVDRLGLAAQRRARPRFEQELTQLFADFERARVDLERDVQGFDRLGIQPQLAERLRVDDRLASVSARVERARIVQLLGDLDLFVDHDHVWRAGHVRPRIRQPDLHRAARRRSSASPRGAPHRNRRAKRATTRLRPLRLRGGHHAVERRNLVVARR